MCIRTSFLHLFYFFPIHPAGPVWLKGSECCPISYLWTESCVKFASFATVKDPWKLLMLSCPSVGVWFIHLKLPELRWVKPWSCLLLSVIMMQLKKRKQKERKGLHVREIWVQLNKSGPTRSVTLSLTLWTLWAVCFPAARWELWAKWNTLRQSYFTKTWVEVHKEKKTRKLFQYCVFLYFQYMWVVTVHINLARSPLTQILLQELHLHLRWQILSWIVLSRWGNLLLQWRFQATGVGSKEEHH